MSALETLSQMIAQCQDLLFMLRNIKRIKFYGNASITWSYLIKASRGVFRMLIQLFPTRLQYIPIKSLSQGTKSGRGFEKIISFI